MANAHNGVAHKTLSGIFVIRFHVVTLHYVFDGKNYAFCSLVFQKAGIGGNYAMSSCCIHAVKYLAIRMSTFTLCSIGVFSK